MGNREIMVIGDRVLLKQAVNEAMTKVGLILPQTVVEKENVQAGHVITVGPGIPVPMPGVDEDEPWRAEQQPRSKYMPLQAEPGDYALFLKKHAVEVKIDGEDYVIVPHSAILILMRDDPHSAD
ncbi:co-chaperone GroES [Candidatus Sumerlaeota bacterium]|nr:co-chaperone GroES [Candidatus Sumerlaeota bacterium]